MPKIKTATNDPNYHWFHCPGCDEHHAFNDGPGGWTFNRDYEKPTVRNSVLVTGGVSGTVCHSFVTDGEIRFLDDSTHALAGQTVELPDVAEWPY